MFECYDLLWIILEDIARHEILLKDVIEKVEKHLESSTDEEEWEELLFKGEAIAFYA